MHSVVLKTTLRKHMMTSCGEAQLGDQFPLIINKCLVTLYALKSVCIFSIMFSIHFLRCWQGEFVEQSRTSLVGDHFLYSHDLNVWFRGSSQEKLHVGHCKGSISWQLYLAKHSNIKKNLNFFFFFWQNLLLSYMLFP